MTILYINVVLTACTVASGDQKTDLNTLLNMFLIQYVICCTYCLLMPADVGTDQAKVVRVILCMSNHPCDSSQSV